MAEMVQWTGSNEEELFDFARPHVFMDYTTAERPMMLRTDKGNVRVDIGDLIVKDDSTFHLRKAQETADGNT